VARRCVLSRNLVNEEAKAHWWGGGGAVGPKQRNKCKLIKLDFCLTVHHQLAKVIQINQLDATMIY